MREAGSDKKKALIRAILNQIEIALSDPAIERIAITTERQCVELDSYMLRKVEPTGALTITIRANRDIGGLS